MTILLNMLLALSCMNFDDLHDDDANSTLIIKEKN